MPLLVKYKNDGLGYVTKYELNTLIASDKIEAFKRSNDEWVDPKVGPLRGQGSGRDYMGPDRRSRF